MPAYTLRVHYPAPTRDLVVRTELDWSTDLRGTPIADGAEFRFESDRPWLYFKPCLRTAGGLRWLPGMNRIAEAGPVRDIYPTFLSGLGGTLTALQELDGTRFRVYLPAGYEENTLKRYPVVYMHDGGNLFLPEEAFLGRAWEVDELLDTLHELSVIDQVMVIGIHPGAREHQYTQDGYQAFATWCADVLRPWVDGQYRTLTGPRHTSVVGSSLGGVVALHTAWSRPDAFGRAGCLSSTFGWRDDLFQRVASDPVPALQIYLDSGWPHDNFERTVAMRDLLLHRGLRHGSDLLYLAFPGARHDENAWGGRLHIPFQWFFGRAPGKH